MLSGWPRLMPSRSQVCLFGALCVVLAAWGVQPATVVASCGDYLVHHGESGTSTAHADRPLSKSTPCRGPLCRRSQSPQEAPPPAVVRWTMERWAVVAPLEVTPDSTGTFRSWESAVRVPSPLVDRLDRPPRAV